MQVKKKADTKPVKNRVIKTESNKPKSQMRQIQAEYNSTVSAKNIAKSRNKTIEQQASSIRNTESVSSKYFPKQEYFYTDNKEQMWNDKKVQIQLEKKIFAREERSTDIINHKIFNKVLTNILN